MSSLVYTDKKRQFCTARQFFDMVMDIDKYQTFLPYCVASKILEVPREGVVLARMVLTFKGIRQEYTSYVETREEGGYLYIDVKQYGSGPFSVLRNEWIFEPDGDGCIINFELEMKLKSVFVQRLVGIVMSGVGRRMVEAFEERAKILFP